MIFVLTEKFGHGSPNQNLGVPFLARRKVGFGYNHDMRCNNRVPIDGPKNHEVNKEFRHVPEFISWSTSFWMVSTLLEISSRILVSLFILWENCFRASASESILVDIWVRASKTFRVSTYSDRCGN